MHSYIKIKAVFAKDTKAHTIVGSFSDPAFEYLRNLQWLGSEKIDGTNITIAWDGHRVSFQGAVEGAPIADFAEAWLKARFGSPDVEELFEQTFGDKPTELHGELYGHRIGKAGELMLPRSNDFVLFDVVINGFWLKREAVEKVASEIGVAVVPIAAEDTLDGLIDLIASKGQTLKEHVSGNEAPLEGLVAFPKVPLFYRDGTPIKTKIKVHDLVPNGYDL